MSNQLHLSRHETLNKAVRELVSDFISSTDTVPTTIVELLDWSKEHIKKEWTDTLKLNNDIDRTDVQRELKKETTV